MDLTTFFIYMAMYIYGFGLMIWALYFDKHPTQRTLKAAKYGIIALLITTLYFFYALATRGIK